MLPMLSELFIKGDNGWVVLAHKTISVPLKANPDYKRLKQVPNLIISLDTEVSTPLQLSNTPQNPITDLIGY